MRSFLSPKILLPLCISLTSQAQELVEIAQSPERMWNGVTVSSDGRIFVAMPVMQGAGALGVAEVLADGSLRPFPGGEWNAPREETPDGKRFLGVNAVVSDKDDQLWVVDPAGGFGSSPQEGKAKLVKIDIASGEVKRIYTFSSMALPKGGFINDVRLTETHAVLTDSSLGALVMVNLETGENWRRLAEDPRLKADPDLRLTINGKPYLNSKGETPRMNVNTMDIDPSGTHLYFQPNGGPGLWRIRLDLLCDPGKSDSDLQAAVESAGPGRFNAGMTFAPDGSLYYSDISVSGITRRLPDGTFETLVSDPERIAWPDASRIGPDGWLYFPAAQVNLLPGNTEDGKSHIQKPFRLFKLKLP